MSGTPFAIKVIPLYVLFYVALTSWWWTISNFLADGRSFEALGTGYSLPIVFFAIASLLRRARGRGANIGHFIALLILTTIYLGVVSAFGRIPQSDVSPYIGISFISGIMSLMTFPLAPNEPYALYKSPLFIGGVVFMPLFIYLAAVLTSSLAPIPKASIFIAGIIGFWGSAAWLGSRLTQGRHVPGLRSPFTLSVNGMDARPRMPFRPDLILPGGVNYVKGVILSGVGLLIMFQPEKVFPPPVWNWWGFVLAFWGIIIIIPVRGIYKMLKGRARRMLGADSSFGGGAGIGRDTILFAGLLILLYGFINAFMGAIPFTMLIPGRYVMPNPDPLAAWYGLTLIVLAYIVIVPVRGAYKAKLKEGIETFAQLVAKQVLLHLGTLLLIYGFVTMFMGNFLTPHPDTNPLGFGVGLGLVLGGAVLILLVRPLALRNEFSATMRVMVGVISELSEDERSAIMRRRLNTLALMSDEQRKEHVKWMMEGLKALPEENRNRLVKTQIEALSALPGELRTRIIRTMDELTILAPK
ncbi:MAG: hypothetical protein HY619_00555 [Thaumarchaeota archaeon]|nr:hypothetical protein [Nitrososphaerota archaeon]